MVKEVIAKLLFPEKSMVLRPIASDSKAVTIHSTSSTPGGLGEEKGCNRPQKGDFNGQMSFATASKDLSLYFHIPFCSKKCPYCHFYVIPNKSEYQKILKEALLLEWQQKKGIVSKYRVPSIYFGGGTPSLFRDIDQILKVLPVDNDTEITIEANPEEATFEMFSFFRSTGINRLSLGVQSLDDRSLQTIERIHSAQKAKQAILDAKRAGFENISIDLMYDLPSQTLSSFEHTLKEVKDLQIQHLSLYNLTIEPHTAFFKRKVKLPTQEHSLKLLNLALIHLEEMGLNRYEISAFSKPGFESRHNLGYWTARPFLGFGPSAFSYFEKRRFQNICHLHRYHKKLKEGLDPIDFEEKLPYPNDLLELLVVNLRVLEGVDLGDGSLPDETLKTIARLEKEGLLKQSKAQLKLTNKGTLFYDTIASEIINLPQRSLH